ncbi:MAG: GNAT family N-acetyltransferase [Oscillospiraceae bacterium]|nr:GNAT family N-acetyltransferase [Oscillospiraceae bacterium]
MLRLRQYKSCDAETIVAWCKDEISFRKWCSDRWPHFPITAEAMNEKYFGNNGDCPDADNFYPITALDGNEVVGHLILRYTDEERKVLRFGFVIVDNTKRGKGYGKEMLTLTLKLAFDIMCAEKVTLGVFDNNAPAYHCYKAAGFSETGKCYSIELLGDEWKCIEMELERKDYYDRQNTKNS